MKFTGDIDRRQVKAAELQAYFDALDTEVNTTKLGTDLLGKQEIVHRHLNFSPTIHLAARTPTIMTTTATGGGYYKVNELVLKYTPSDSSAPNQEGAGFPMVEVGFKGGFIGTCDPTPTKVMIGFSPDGGANWFPFDGTVLGTFDTSRGLAKTAGIEKSFYASPVQPDPYVSSMPDRYPLNYPFARCVELTAHFGGVNGSGYDPTLISHYCIMLDGPVSDTCNGFGFFTLDARY